MYNSSVGAPALTLVEDAVSNPIFALLAALGCGKDEAPRIDPEVELEASCVVAESDHGRLVGISEES